jgi:hypothetical protein
MSEEDQKLKDKEEEIIVSFDVEADRPCPGIDGHNGCLCVALVALRKPRPDENVLYPDVTKRLIIGHLVLYPATSGNPDKDTYDWWQSEEDGRKDMYREFKLKQKSIKHEVDRLAEWYFGLVDRFKKVKFVANPGPFDWPWLNWLWCSYRKRIDDVKGVIRRWPYKCDDASSIENLAWDEWKSFDEELNKLYPHKHDAYEDALRQGLAHLHIERETVKLIQLGIETKKAIETSEYKVSGLSITEMIHKQMEIEHVLALPENNC